MKPNYDYQKIDVSMIEKAVAEVFSKLPAEDDDEVDFKAFVRGPEEIERIISKPDSPYNKILSGYWYKIDGQMFINTGCGGAQHIYRMFLKEGLSEEMIEQLIYVYVDEDYVPLAALKIKKR